MLQRLVVYRISYDAHLFDSSNYNKLVCIHTNWEGELKPSEFGVKGLWKSECGLLLCYLLMTWFEVEEGY